MINKVKRMTEASFLATGDFAYVPEKLKKFCMSIDSIHLDKRNPRKNDEAVGRLADLIKEHGFRKPIVIDQYGEIRAGNTAYKAACLLGMKYIPTAQSHFENSSVSTAYTISDNKSSEWSEWDKDILSRLLVSENLIDSLEKTGMTNKEMDDLDIFGTREKVKTILKFDKGEFKDGDIVEIDKRHRVGCGDAADIDFMKKIIGDDLIEIGFTSPPYNMGGTPRQHNKRMKKVYGNNIDRMKSNVYHDLLVSHVQNSLQFCQYVFVNVQMLAQNKISLIDVLHTLQINLADIIIWCKDIEQPAIYENVLNSDFEFVLIFSKQGKRVVGCKPFRGTLNNVITFKRVHTNKYSEYHAATFSEEFAKHFVLNFTNRGAFVLDAFAGTGTTMIACERLKRRGIMIDNDPGMCNLMVERYCKEFTNAEVRKY